MRPINQLTITGNVGSDAEFRATGNGDPVCNFRIAHERSRYDEQSQQWVKLNTTWWSVALWDKKAQELARQITKGTRVIVTGRAEMREYTTRDGGQGVSADIRADHVAIIPDTRSTQPSQSQGSGDPWKSTNRAGGGDQPPF